MKKRIIGIDVARALAVIGMIIVNFKTVFGSEGNELLRSISGIFEGKAAATFVVLAGIGLALMSNSAIKNNDHQKIKKAKIRIAKRALFLFVVGLSYIVIWPADILHFYGIYMLVVLIVLHKNQKTIFITSVLLILCYPLLMLLINYDTGWDFDALTYIDFWTVEGFIRNLFYNGFHPVIPWAAFMLIGVWFGKQNMDDTIFIKKAIIISGTVFILIQIISYLLIVFLSEGDYVTTNELKQVLGTSPMPPLPIYMISGSSIALFVISSCIYIAKKLEGNMLIKILKDTGQLALTFYVAHVFIGMGAVEIFNPEKMGEYTIVFSLSYALVFSALCILFAILWKKYKSSGPLEWVMRKLTD